MAAPMYTNTMSIFWFFCFALSLTSYMASAELLSVQDPLTSENPDWSLSNNIEGPNHCQAMLVSLNKYQHRFSFDSSKARLSLLYLACLLLSQSPDGNPNFNPGPRGRKSVPKWPCGDCHKNVSWKQKGLFCENCETWYHASCQGMRSVIYEVAHLSTVEWECTNCGVPNFSSTLFDLSSLEHSNSFSAISDSTIGSPGIPQATSSPVNQPHPTRPPNHNPNPTRQTPRNSKLGNALRVVNINFQSVMSKKAELHHLIDSTKPDIIIGTETWLLALEPFCEKWGQTFRHGGKWRHIFFKEAWSTDNENV